jgi:ComF family protein
MPQSKHAWREITRATEATTQISQGKAIYLYQGPIKETMYRFKYSNKREYAEFFAEEAVRIYGDWMKRKNIQAIVPVPMYMPKQRRRGYNQAETFAKALGRKMNIPVDATLVKRVKDTKPQKELNDLERKNNLKNAFQKTESIVQYSHILVVDDIYTTGSTAMAVAEQLRKTNTCQVYFLSICIGKGM